MSGVERQLLRPRSVLLTGATGNLGSHLCAMLLEHTSATVHCLVRAPGTAQALHRLRQRLDDLDPAPRHPEPRLTAVPGDLNTPRFGLSPQAFDALAESVDAIVHCAASVNLAADYQQLAGTNHESLTQIVALARRRAALTSHPAAIHHISTVAVYLTARPAGLDVVDESTPVSHATCGPHGYPRSKADAEARLRQAALQHGLPLAIYRPGVITGHSLTGRITTTDPLVPLLKAGVALGVFPPGNIQLPGDRVDLVARSIAALLDQPSEPGRAYHLISPAPLRLADVTAALRRAGHPIQEVPATQWWQHVERHIDNPDVRPIAALRAISSPFLGRADERMPNISCEATWTALRMRGVHPTPWTAAFFGHLVDHLLPRTRPAAPRSLHRIRPRTPDPAPQPLPPAVRISGLATPVTFEHDGHYPDFAQAAAACQAAGYGGFWAAEQRHNPLLALAQAVPHTSLPLGTAAVVALARNPMTLAHAAHDLHMHSRGRLTLGIGSQVKANLTYRYAMPANDRLARMRDFIQALRAIWASWNNRSPLAFRSRHYTHIFSNPFFTPPPSPWGPPKLFLAATGPRMAELAGELADGLIAPPYAPPRLLSEVLLPALDRGLARSDRTDDDISVVCPPLIITGRTAQQRAALETRTRMTLALFCGTRAYRHVFELYDLGGLADKVSQLMQSDSPDGQRHAADLLDDAAIRTFAAVADQPHQTGEILRRRYGGLADQLLLPAPHGPEKDLWQPNTLGLAAADPTLPPPASVGSVRSPV
ncbi:TIGR03617 family F420-dependent LLM class oxidoreductase [Streptomyces sp. ISL-11]|uniref:TIGR03617 family F420-dependent LLM class oxidoreductase n=1 Tax=Streptomyces sp. ISL-11 TaxID=2819174 RepID=UPI001BEB449C|nr:TIGR03617 family F420-dependent LLM class oxidoreductase [Streptomyces sp. ISL-11]MBT2384961.1 TIGR03617 family F420-dependent LLM class oxidoreductase [Streptomyces sp. ISL-11]